MTVEKGISARPGKWPTSTKQTFALYADLAKVMARVTKRFLRPLGLVAIVVDYQSARWLKSMIDDLPRQRQSGEPWSDTSRKFARDFAELLQQEQNVRPDRWKGPEAPRYP